METGKRVKLTTEEILTIINRPFTAEPNVKSNIFEYFEAVGDWGAFQNFIFTALIEISNIEGLPNNFSIEYIKYKEGVGIRIEYKNAGDKSKKINNILQRLERETVQIIDP